MRQKEARVTILITIAVAIVVGLTVAGTVGTARGPDVLAGVEATPSSAGEVRKVPVLCYHYIRGKSSPVRLLRVFGYVVLSLPLLDDSELWTTSARDFEIQMEYLAQRGYNTVTLDELNEWQIGLRELPQNPVVITFDDGDQSVYDYAYPVLKRLGMRATLFVVTGRVGTRWGEVRCLDWEPLREMQQSGVFDIESHTHDMHYKVNERSDARPVFLAASEGQRVEGVGNWETYVRNDLEQSRTAIQTGVGRTPAYLAWPYGWGNPRVNRIAEEVGFARTLSLRLGPNEVLGSTPSTADTHAFEIARYTITARTSLRIFREMIAGTYVPET